ncbi:hypothetical protein GW17_00046225 [Ensete ventricosum]|nr:hypothetical protein GW17_00046225 [Ensete ventricosum]
MILLIRVFAIRAEVTSASLRSCLGLFSTEAHVYALHTKELSPSEVDPLTMTSIFFSISPFGRGRPHLHKSHPLVENVCIFTLTAEEVAEGIIPESHLCF